MQIGIVLDGRKIDGLLHGGPAYNSGCLERGDVIVDIDGKTVSDTNVHEILVGSDEPGTSVVVTVQKRLKTPSEMSVALTRIPTSIVADSNRFFENCTAIKVPEKFDCYFYIEMPS